MIVFTFIRRILKNGLFIFISQAKRIQAWSLNWNTVRELKNTTDNWARREVNRRDMILNPINTNYYQFTEVYRLTGKVQVVPSFIKVTEGSGVSGYSGYTGTVGYTGYSSNAKPQGVNISAGFSGYSGAGSISHVARQTYPDPHVTYSSTEELTFKHKMLVQELNKELHGNL